MCAGRNACCATKSRSASMHASFRARKKSSRRATTAGSSRSRRWILRRCHYNAAMREFSRIKRLPPYVLNITNELKMAARRRGEDVIDLSMGNPDGPTRKHIVEKLCEAAGRQDTHGYSVSKGIPRLRKAICDWYQRRYEVELDPESKAIVTIGSKEGLAHLMLACLEHGDT